MKSLHIDKFTFHLIATTHDRKREIERLIISLDNQNSIHQINLYILIQDNESLKNIIKKSNNINIKTILINKRLGLSAARNYVLKQIEGIKDSDIVGFPDDDCWYEPNIIDNIAEKFSKYPFISFLSTSVYDPIDKKPYGKRPNYDKLQISKSDLFLLPISVGIFIRYDALKHAGLLFNESLGLGTELGSGEETEVIYRLMKKGFKGSYFGSLRVYHLIERPEERSFAKSLSYGKGFGYLNSIILKSRDFSQFIFLLRIILTSMIGAFYILVDGRKAKSYIGRLIGTVIGLFRGLSARGGGVS